MQTPGHPPERYKPPTASQHTAANLRGLMAANNLTNADMATALGISEKASSRRRQGHHDFKLNELAQIAAWLKVPVESLTTPVEPPRDAPNAAQHERPHRGAA